MELWFVHMKWHLFLCHVSVNILLIRRLTLSNSMNTTTTQLKHSAFFSQISCIHLKLSVVNSKILMFLGSTCQVFLEALWSDVRFSVFEFLSSITPLPIEFRIWLITVPVFRGIHHTSHSVIIAAFLGNGCHKFQCRRELRASQPWPLTCALDPMAACAHRRSADV